MEAAIREYAIPRRGIWIPALKGLATFVGLAALSMLVHWGFDSVPNRTHHLDALEVLCLPVLLAAWWTFEPLVFPERKSLTLGEDFIEYRAKSRILSDRRHLRRDRITSLRETKEGLWVKDSSPFGTFMLSTVLVPASMPEYNEIKETLLRWKAAAPAVGTS
jgi:hypothetical protein